MELIEQLNRIKIDPQSYFLLKAGFKPVIRMCCDNKDIDYIVDDLEKFCKNHKIHILIKKVDDEFYDSKIKEPLSLVYLSTSKDTAERTYGAEKNQDRETLGELLGYPECCVDNFIKNLKGSSVDMIINSLLNTKTKPSFYCNFIFNFDSKLNVNSAPIYQKNYDKIFHDTDYFFLIRHIPCSFDCKESIDIGKKTLEILKKELPELAEKIVSALKRPVLYFDNFNWIVFDGEVQNYELRYKQVLPYKSLFPSEKLDIIKQGNKLKVLDDKILISKDDKLISIIEKEDKSKGIIIDFS